MTGIVLFRAGKHKNIFGRGRGCTCMMKSSWIIRTKSRATYLFLFPTLPLLAIVGSSRLVCYGVRQFLILCLRKRGCGTAEHKGERCGFGSLKAEALRATHTITDTSPSSDPRAVVPRPIKYLILWSAELDGRAFHSQMCDCKCK